LQTAEQSHSKIFRKNQSTHLVLSASLNSKLQMALSSQLQQTTISQSATMQQIPLGAGIEVEGNGEFYVGSAASVITFDVGTGVSAGNPKTIVKSDAGRLEFGTITIAANPNNEVATASDFKITGTGASTFVNSGAGGKFTATAGTITFTGAAPQISSISPASTQFYSIRTEGATALTVPNQAQELYVAAIFLSTEHQVWTLQLILQAE
jgi:hypothetical protein